METTLTLLFNESNSVDDFRMRVMGLQGDFSFEAGDMLDLGNAYLKKYPDSFENRNSEHVLIGYEIVRICITEKLAASCRGNIHDKIRKMFASIPCIEPCVQEFVQNDGYDAASAILGDMGKCLDEIKFTIETLKPGVVKERYIGGISKFYNILYLMRLSMEKFRG